MRKSIMPIVALMISYQALSQQVIEMSEEDIDMTVLTWHYRAYENSQSSSWFVKAFDGVGYFHVSFVFEGDNYEAIYDDQGFIIAEKKFMGEDRLPQPILDLLDYRVVKYKFNTFTRESQFENRKPIRIDYRVDVRTKTGGIVVFWFDQDFNLIPENRDDIAIR